MTSREFATINREYHVRVFGNGWAYEVIDNEDGRSLWFQDDDAQYIEDDTNNFENERAIAQYFELTEDF